LLRESGIPSIHTLEAGNRGISDEQQLAFAAAHEYIVVSHNRKHFRVLHKTWLAEGRQHNGILVMGFSTPEVVARRIQLFFERVYPSLRAPFCEVPPNPEARI
jgi:hypothetical protein